MFPRPVTEEAGRLLDLWWTSNYLALAVAAVVVGLLVYVVVRYRDRPGDAGADRPTSDTTHNVPAEIAYTAVPLAIVAVLFGLTLAAQRTVLSTARHPDLEVEVVGFTWQWQFRYPAEDITVVGTYDDPAELVLPVGRTVRLDLRTTDVIHSFWVPEFLAKRDLIPGVRNRVDVHVKETGRWVGRCAEFCGLDHHRMRFVVRAVPPTHFQAWIDEQRD